MKRLSRLLLINWLNFSYELIEFGTVNFMTGKNGSGKSTIIDALQLVMFADTQGSSFNKAANQRSDRSLESYLYGDLGIEDGPGTKRGKKGKFTSYVAVQFDDDVTNKSFVAAFVADCFSDRKIKKTWLIAHERLSHGSFLDEKGVPYAIDGLKMLYKAQVKQSEAMNFEFEDTNKAYMARLNYYLGSVDERYFSLLKKGVPFSFSFTQTSDITRFITESVCDVDSHIDVDAMQNDIRQYADLEVQAKEMERKIAQLEEIGALSRKLDDLKITLREYQYLIDRALLEEKKRDKDTAVVALAKLEDDRAAKEKALAAIKTDIDKAEAEIEAIRKEIYTSDEHAKKEKLEEQIAALKAEISRLSKILEKSRSECASFLASWNAIAKDPLFMKVADPLPPVGAFSLNEKNYPASLKKGVEALDLIYDGLVSRRSECRFEKTQLEEEITALNDQIKNLEKGIKAFPQAVIEFRTLLEKHKIGSLVVADSAEVLNEEWRPVLEGVLDRDRFALIVPEECYETAFGLLEGFEGRENVTVVDMARLSEPEVVPSSLLDEIHSDDERVSRYLAYLLGPVSKGALPHSSSASQDGRVYRNSAITHLGSDFNAFPFLGQNAIRLAISRLNAERKDKEQELAAVVQSLRFLNNALALRRIGKDQLDEYMDRLSLSPQIDSMTDELKALNAELASIDMLYIENLEKRQREKEAEKRDLEANRSSAERALGNLEAEVRNHSEVLIPELEREIAEKQESLSSAYDTIWQERMEGRFRKEFDSCRSGSLMSANFTPVLRKTEIEIGRVSDERRKKRTAYNTSFLTPFDASQDANTQFDEELERLRSFKLPEYLDKIKEAKERAYKQFRDDFIAKMKRNIETVEGEVQKLNKALKLAVFGSDRYRFIVSPNPKFENFYRMFNDPLLMSLDQPSLMDDLFNEKYKDEISSLFSSLMLPSAEDRASYENSVKLYTDYRTYLIFDLEVVDTITSTRQRLSRTWKKKSGGETQQPFYLALLASFSQVCRINKQGVNNTVRLIMLDEAFSKMDGDRIKASIELLKEFNLQAIFSAPPEKIPDISPLVDRTIIVFKDKDHSFTRCYQMKEEGNEHRA